MSYLKANTGGRHTPLTFRAWVMKANVQLKIQHTIAYAKNGYLFILQLKRDFQAMADTLHLGQPSTSPKLMTPQIVSLVAMILRVKYSQGKNSLVGYSDFISITQIIFFMPHSGIRLEALANWATPVSENSQFGILRSQLSLFKQLDRNEDIIIASQIGWGQMLERL
ncbi:MAG: hypothetical protein U5K54_04940 [Cytophagales bacterium]|nr:hypothetical protein [Cytophagales bacterium]